MTVAWEEQGSGTRPLVLVHGFTGSRDDWSDVFLSLADKGRTVMLDQRGHGASSRSGQYTVDLLVEDLAVLLDDLGISSCDLLGHSLGGMVALRYALAHRARVASLVLMDTSPYPLPGLLTEINDLAEAHGFDWLVEQQPHLARMDPAAFFGLVGSLGSLPPVTERLAEIGCPTTVLVGADDLPFLEPSRSLAAGIAGAELVVIPGAAHSPQREATQAWLTVIYEHLERVRTA